jgi:hypothetical protein
MPARLCRGGMRISGGRWPGSRRSSGSACQVPNLYCLKQFLRPADEAFSRESFVTDVTGIGRSAGAGHLRPCGRARP